LTTRPGEARCDLSDLLVSQCAHCTGRTGDSGGRTPPPEQQDDAPSPAPGRRRPAVHVCLSCGGKIARGQPEETVPAARSPEPGDASHRHTRVEDCQAALARPPGGNAALIGRYRELAPVRVVRTRYRDQTAEPEP
jgi:hypothetical protein